MIYVACLYVAVLTTVVSSLAGLPPGDALGAISVLTMIPSLLFFFAGMTEGAKHGDRK